MGQDSLHEPHPRCFRCGRPVEHAGSTCDRCMRVTARVIGARAARAGSSRRSSRDRWPGTANGCSTRGLEGLPAVREGLQSDGQEGCGCRHRGRASLRPSRGKQRGRNKAPDPALQLGVTRTQDPCSQGGGARSRFRLTFIRSARRRERAPDSPRRGTLDSRV